MGEKPSSTHPTQHPLVTWIVFGGLALSLTAASLAPEGRVQLAVVAICLVASIVAWRGLTANTARRRRLLLTIAAATVAGALGVATLSPRPPDDVRVTNFPAPPSEPLTQPVVPQPSADGDSCSESSEGDVGAGWGPDRPTYHDTTFPPALTFNSTSTNPVHGDERNFFQVKDMQTGEWSDDLEVRRDRTYLGFAYVRLDGPDTGVASGVRIKFNLPTCTGHRIGINALLEGGNDVYPGLVWDSAEVWAREDFNLAYVPDSARYYNNAHPYPQGVPIPLSVLEAKGAAIGYKKMDGKFKPGYKFSGYLTFEFRPQFAP